MATGRILLNAYVEGIAGAVAEYEKAQTTGVWDGYGMQRPGADREIPEELARSKGAETHV